MLVAPLTPPDFPTLSAAAVSSSWRCYSLKTGHQYLHLNLTPVFSLGAQVSSYSSRIMTVKLAQNKQQLGYRLVKQDKCNRTVNLYFIGHSHARRTNLAVRSIRSVLVLIFWENLLIISINYVTWCTRWAVVNPMPSVISIWGDEAWRKYIQTDHPMMWCSCAPRLAWWINTKALRWHEL